MKIALMGYARSGKDTVANMIKEELGKVWTVAFGDELKVQFHKTFDIPADPKPRDGYEKFGQALREIDPAIWIKPVQGLVKFIEANWRGRHIVITDLRQVNEAKWVKENGFTIVYIHADPHVRQARAVGDKEWHSINSSEAEIWMIDYDYCIWNEADENNLRIQVKNLINDHLGVVQ